MGTYDNMEPVAEGNFSQTPFAHILMYIWERRMTGTLRVHDSSNEISVYFREGTPAKVRSSFPSRSLGQVMLDLRAISENQKRAGEEEISKTRGLLGQALVKSGAIDAQTLIQCLREQMLLKLTDVFGMPAAAYAFYQKVNTLVGFGPDELFPLDTFPLLMVGLRTHADAQKLAMVCCSLHSRWVSAEDAESVRRFSLNHAEKSLLEELLDSPQSYNQLIGSGRHDARVVYYVLYALMITKLIVIDETGPQIDKHDHADHPSQLDSIDPAPSAAPEDPATTQKKQKVMDKAAAIASQNYYEMLGLPFGAPAEDVRKAFFRMAKEYHPDKVTSAVLADLKETIQYVFSNLSEAHSTLIDHEAREEYEAAVRESQQRTSKAPEAAADTEVHDVLQAENLFQKSLVFLKREQYDKAQALIDRARSLNPDEGEYLAVWAHLQQLTRPNDANTEDLMDALRRALETNPKSERANLYLAQMLKRVGRESEAKLCFGKVIEVNPHNIEAARELRLIEMRKKKHSTKPPSFLKRFFK